MSIIYLFVIGVFFSALGALAPGIINLAVAMRTIYVNRRAGVMVTLGAGLVELIYTFIAIFFIDLILGNGSITKYIDYFALLVFLSIALFYAFSKPQKPKADKSKSSMSKHFGYGIVVAAMNMLIIPTWLFIGAWLRSNGFDFNFVGNIISISLGSAVGAMIVFLGYVRLGAYIVRKLSKVIRYTNRFLATIFFILAAYQLFKILFNR